MKMKYIKPFAEAVNIRLNRSTLESVNMAKDSERARSWDTNEHQFEWEEEASSNLPNNNVNLWDE